MKVCENKQKLFYSDCSGFQHTVAKTNKIMGLIGRCKKSATVPFLLQSIQKKYTSQTEQKPPHVGINKCPESSYLDRVWYSQKMYRVFYNLLFFIIFICPNLEFMFIQKMLTIRQWSHFVLDLSTYLHIPNQVFRYIFHQEHHQT